MTSFSQQFVLTIVNTKAAAREIYSEAPCVLLDAGYAPTVIDTTMPDVQIRDRARKYAVRNPQRTHERCLLCPVHCRRSWGQDLARGASTALIEAELPGHCAQSGRAAEHRACPPAAPASWPDTEHIDNLPGDFLRYVSGHFRALAQTQLDVIVELLNDRPRSCSCAQRQPGRARCFWRRTRLRPTRCRQTSCRS